MSIVMRVAPECLEAFCTASRQLKYTAASTSGAQRGTSEEARSTGIGPDSTAADNAVPARRRSAVGGYSPLDSAVNVSMVALAAAACSASSRAPRSGDRPSSVWASRRLTSSAMTSCWAPSWMLRSNRCRSASCRVDQVPSGLAQLLGASLQRRPAAARAQRGARPPGASARTARPSRRTAVSSTGVSSCPSRTTTASAPSSSPRSRTARLRRDPSMTTTGAAPGFDRPEARRARPMLLDRAGATDRANRRVVAHPASGREFEPAAHRQPDLAPRRAGALRQHPGHPGGQFRCGNRHQSPSSRNWASTWYGDIRSCEALAR